MAGPEPLASQAFSVGLMHDIGRLVLAGCHVHAYEQVLVEARESGRALDALERKRMGASHAGVGAYLLGMWGLPQALVGAVARHHASTLRPEDELAAMVQVAHGVAGEVHGTDTGDGWRAVLELSPFRARLPAWEALAREEAELATGGRA